MIIVDTNLTELLKMDDNNGPHLDCLFFFSVAGGSERFMQ